MPSTAALKVMMQSATSDQPKITRKADHSGYVTPLGVMPPVTTILSETSPPESKAALEAWKRRTPVEYQKTGAKRALGCIQPASIITTPANGRTT